jgi:archaellum component FlaC
MTMNETDVLKAHVVNLESEVERLKKANADLQKHNEKLSRDASGAESDQVTAASTNYLNAHDSNSQAKNVLVLLARVNAAKQWMKKVKDLDALLAGE